MCANYDIPPTPTPKAGGHRQFIENKHDSEVDLIGENIVLRED